MVVMPHTNSDNPKPEFVTNLGLAEACMMCIQNPSSYLLRGKNFAPNIFVVYSDYDKTFFIMRLVTDTEEGYNKLENIIVDNKKMPWSITYSTPSDIYTIYDINMFIKE